MGTQQSSGGEERAKASAHSRRGHPARGHPVHVCLWQPRRRGRHHRREHQQGRQDRRRSRRCRGICPLWVWASRTRSTWPSSRPTRPRPSRAGRSSWTAEDDEAKPDVGKNAATKLAGDDEVVGVVGTLNSSVSQSVQPVLAAANIAQISPANTGPSLTKGRGSGQPEAAVPHLLPDLHHRRRPGSASRRTTCSTQRHQEGRHHPRQEGLRPGPGRRLHRGRSRAAAARSSPPRRSTPMTRTSRPSSPRSRVPTPRPSTTAVSTRRPVRSASR